MGRSLHGLIAASIAAITLSLPAAAADTIKIGLVNEASGANAEAGTYTANGARLALAEINAAGGVLGKQIELRLEDNQSTNPGTVLAFSKLLSEGELAGIIGPIRSTQIQAASPTIAKAGIPTMIGGTDPSLTHVNNRWVFRCRPNDSFSSLVISDFGVNTLKLTKWAIVHSTDAFGSGGKDALVSALSKLGITPVLVQGYTNNSQDFTPIVLAIKKSGADIIGTYMTNSPDVGIFAKQLRQLGINAQWVGSPSVVTDTAMKLAGSALSGVYGIADFTPGASAEAKSYAEKYKAQYKTDADVYSSWAYDAMHVLALAINKAKSTKPEDVRKAILDIRGYKGVEGTYAFDENGDGLRGYNVVKNEDGKVKFIKHIDFPEKK
ncbi:MAG TPA: ABC transporter substrate-binding protein [Burkholderiales bacterium]|nr:ABC transporter substrate-binding protein [Burkholderiales bacterium]